MIYGANYKTRSSEGNASLEGCRYNFNVVEESRCETEQSCLADFKPKAGTEKETLNPDLFRNSDLELSTASNPIMLLNGTEDLGQKWDMMSVSVVSQHEVRGGGGERGRRRSQNLCHTLTSRQKWRSSVRNVFPPHPIMSLSPKTNK